MDIHTELSDAAAPAPGAPVGLEAGLHNLQLQLRGARLRLDQGLEVVHEKRARGGVAAAVGDLSSVVSEFSQSVRELDRQLEPAREQRRQQLEQAREQRRQRELAQRRAIDHHQREHLEAAIEILTTFTKLPAYRIEWEHREGKEGEGAGRGKKWHVAPRDLTTLADWIDEPTRRRQEALERFHRCIVPTPEVPDEDVWDDYVWKILQEIKGRFKQNQTDANEAIYDAQRQAVMSLKAERYRLQEVHALAEAITTGRNDPTASPIGRPILPAELGVRPGVGKSQWITDVFVHELKRLRWYGVKGKELTGDFFGCPNPPIPCLRE